MHVVLEGSLQPAGHTYVLLWTNEFDHYYY